MTINTRTAPRSLLRNVTLLSLTFALAVPALADKGKPARRVDNARFALQELLEIRDKSVPEKLLKNARCIGVFPGVIKGAVGIGGRHGRGVVSCRTPKDKWSPPAFFKLSGGSIGFQIGAESSDLALFFMTERSVKSLLDSQFTLGADVGVAAGPLGRSAEASTDLKLNAEIYSYARSRGLYAGASVEGARISADHRASRRFYGRRVWPEDLLYEGKSPRLPREAKSFVAALP